MTKKHNKKRNVGIVYEQLLRYISTKIIENRQDMSKKAVKILEKRFSKKTELYKEFRLVNALVNSTVSGTHVAAGILTEAKQAARNIDQLKLMKEKSLLIKEINYELNESSFFHKKIDNYKTYATVQMLINEWTKKDRSDLAKQIEYEKLVVEHLIAEKQKTMTIDENKADKLVFQVMSKKINEKYGHNLSSEQKDIIRNYAIYNRDPQALTIFLENLKLKTLKQLDLLRETSDNTVLLSKVDLVYENLSKLSSESVNDDAIKKYLTISNLKQQLLRSENE
jgi:hypothetical protein